MWNEITISPTIKKKKKKKSKTKEKAKTRQEVETPRSEIFQASPIYENLIKW
jgi:hypothetical protein